MANGEESFSGLFPSNIKGASGITGQSRCAGGHRGFVVVTGRSELHFSKVGGQRVTKSDPLSSRFHNR